MGQHESLAQQLAAVKESESKLLIEREQILQNWSEETEGLVTVYREDKAAWERERKRLSDEIALLRERVGGSSAGGNVNGKHGIGGDGDGDASRTSSSGSRI